MKKPYTVLLAFVLASFLTSAQMPRHVILISIDGFRPEFYLDPSWPTPNLQRLMKEGVYAQAVRGVFPSVTYPSHTTIITGALPSKHGIYYNAPFEPMGATGKWYWETKMIKTPTLWDAVHQAGLTSGAVIWPVSVGAPIDYNIADIWSTAEDADRVQPMKENAHPKGLFEELEQQATGRLTSKDLDAEYFTMDDNMARMGAQIIMNYKPNLFAIHLICVDEWEHNEGRDGPTVKNAVASADHCVGKLLEAVERAGIKDSTAVIVMGDHGFMTVHSAVFPNVWLRNKGLITKENKKVVSWKARFQCSAGSAMLYLKDTGDKKTLEEVRRALDDIPPQQKKLFTVLEKNALKGLGIDPAVSMVLVPMPGFALYNNDEGEAVRPTPQPGVHGYPPDMPELKTGFIASGVGIRKGGIKLAQMGLEDVAPIIARLLNLPFTAPDGILYPGIIAGK